MAKASTKPALSPDDGQHDDQQAAFLASLTDSDGRVRVMRQNAQGKYAYLGEFESADFQPDEVARRWGGGSYRLQLIDRGGVIRASNSFEIDSSIRPAAPRMTLPASRAAYDDERSPNGGEALDYQQRLEMERLKWQLEALQRDLSMRPQIASNGGDSTLSKIIEALVPTLLTKVVERTSPIADIMEAFKAFRQMAQEEGGGVSGGGGDGIDWGSLATALMQFVSTQQAQAATQQPARPTSATPERALNDRAAQEPTQQQQEPKQPKPKQRDPFAPIVGIIRLGADSDGDPQDYAGVVLDMIDRSGIDAALFTQAQTDELVGWLSQQYPPLASIVDYVVRVIEAMRERVADDDAPDADTDPDAANAAPEGEGGAD